MWTEKLKNGKYKATERYEDPITGKIKKMSVTADKKKAAMDALREKLEDALTVKYETNLTFAELCDRFLKYQKAHVRESSYLSWKTRISTLRKLIGDDAMVRKLTASYVAERIDADNPVTTNNRITYVKVIIRWAYAHDYIESKEWLDKIRGEKDTKKRERIEDKYLEPEELKALLDSMTVEKWKILTEFLAFSGLRIGEALALNVDDIDTHIHVTKTFMTGVEKIGDEPKTAESVRDVFIQPELESAIKKAKAHRLEYIIKTGERSEMLFPDANYYAFEHYLKRKSEKIKKITPHTLRHTHVSLLASQGVPLDVISRRLGHSNEKITRGVYFHVTKKLRESDDERISKVRFF